MGKLKTEQTDEITVRGAVYSRSNIFGANDSLVQVLFGPSTAVEEHKAKCVEGEGEFIVPFVFHTNSSQFVSFWEVKDHISESDLEKLKRIGSLELTPQKHPDFIDGAPN